ncbi:MAG: hypothetical protein IJ880_17485 [Bacilli bacterium]|nr:hypothetical protein [Bacilli bacterium]
MIIEIPDDNSIIKWKYNDKDKWKVAEIKAYERPQGEWTYGEDDCGQDGWFCSECNFFVPWYYQYYEDIDFIRDYKVCPHCLAEMVTYTGKDRNKEGGCAKTSGKPIVCCGTCKYLENGIFDKPCIDCNPRKGARHCNWEEKKGGAE